MESSATPAIAFKEKDKKFKEAKAYKSKLKRHKDAVLNLHSIDGINGQFLVSGSADHTVRSKSKLPFSN